MSRGQRVSEFLEITGKVLSVLGSLAGAALAVVKLYREVFKSTPEKDRDPADDAGRRPASDPDEPHQSSGRVWFLWGIGAAAGVFLLGLVLLAVGNRLGKVRPHMIVEKPDAKKVQQARERLQFHGGVPIPVRDLYRGSWDLMYSGILQKEYRGKVILVVGPVSSVSSDSVTLEAGPSPALLTCSFGVRHRDRLKTLREGQLATIRAEMQTYRNGEGGEVLELVECEVVAVEGEGAAPKRPR